MAENWFDKNAPTPDAGGKDWFAANAPKAQAGSPSSRTAMEVAKDQAMHVLEGIPKAVTGIPGAFVSLVNAYTNPQAGLELIKNAVEPLKTIVKGGASLLAEPGFPAERWAEGNPDNPAWAPAAEAAGTNLGGILLAEAAPVAGRAVKAGVKAALPTSEALQEMATANKARALSPTTLQGRADAAAIAEEMSQKGQAGGLRGKTIDRNIVAEHQANTERLNAVEDRLNKEARPEFQTSRRDILSEIDSAKAKLKIPRTGVTARPEAVAQLDEIRGIVSRMPDFIDFDQLIELRRQLDARAEEAGAFGVNANSLKADINRGVADVVRGKLNDLDPALKSANHDYSVSRKAADMVQRRELGETGKINSGLPGRGGILDDILATWAGQAMGGPVGAAAAEAVNLGRQTRGYANVKSSLQQKLAGFMKQPAPQPAGLLTEGVREMPAAETSSVSGTTVQWQDLMQRNPKLLDAMKTVLEVGGTVQTPSGEVFHMPPRPPMLLESGRKMIPEKAGGPYVTPAPPESMLDRLKRMQGPRR